MKYGYVFLSDIWEHGESNGGEEAGVWYKHVL